jgi:hypothetical protein
MPVHKTDGGYKFGDSGKTYRDRDAAVKQMRAMFANGYKSDERLKEPVNYKAELQKLGNDGFIQKYGVEAMLKAQEHLPPKFDTGGGNALGKAHDPFKRLSREAAGVKNAFDKI